MTAHKRPEIPERIYSPGYYCDGCTSPNECDFGGCYAENEAIEEAARKQEEFDRDQANSGESR